MKRGISKLRREVMEIEKKIMGKKERRKERKKGSSRK